MSKQLVLGLLCLFVLCLVCEAKSLKRRAAPPVTLSYGRINGVQDTNANLYLGIPYAQPPLGKLRWQDPVDAMPWKPNVLNAVDFKPACPQKLCKYPNACPNITNEDCLYLNVFVPLNASADNLKAVMLFIHGGNFQYFGANSILYDGRYSANKGDTVIVTINYRLGALGFLVTGTGPNQIHGNFGILDQKLAIKWVKNNIQSFFGDPNRITIYGQSAGAESVAIHTLSTDMQPYFNNAIVQSSPFAIPFREYDEAVAIYFYFAENLNCTVGNVECLMSKSSDDIVNAQMKTEAQITSLKILLFFEPWLPFIDGKIIKGQLLEIEKWVPKGFQFKPLIVGTTTGECYNYVYDGFTKPLTTKMYIEIMFASFKQHGVKLLEHYPPDLTTTDQRQVMTTMCTRWVFACGSRNFLERAQTWSQPQSSTPGFHYVFDFVFDFDGWVDDTFCYNYSCHGSDCPYTFDVPDTNFTSSGHYMSNTHIEYWSNFAKTNNPKSSEGVAWPSYDGKGRQYLKFQKPMNQINTQYLSEECNFFDSIGYYY